MEFHLDDEYLEAGDIENDEVERDFLSHLPEGKRKKKNLFEDTLATQFDPNIIEEAERVSNSMISMQANRDTRRKYRKFACLYYAHDNLAREYDTDRICKLLDMKTNEAAKALNIFSSAKTGYQHRKRNCYDIPDMIRSRCKQLQLSEEEIEFCLDLFQTCDQADPSLRKHLASSIADAVIRTTARIHGIEASQLNSVLRASDTTINVLCSKILQLYNDN
jgi:hypothetical protein